MSRAAMAAFETKRGYHREVTLRAVRPQLLGAGGLRPLRAAIAEPGRFAFELKVDGVRGLVAFGEDGQLETRNRQGQRRNWLRGQPLERSLRRLGQRLPILHHGTVLDGELVADRFEGTMAALHGSKRHGPAPAVLA